MSDKYKIANPDGAIFLTLTVVDWTDVFTRQIYRNIVLDSLKYCQQNKELQVFGYVIMSNHMHLIANSSDGYLSDTLSGFKKYTSRNIPEAIANESESRREWMLNRKRRITSIHARIVSILDLILMDIQWETYF